MGKRENELKNVMTLIKNNNEKDRKKGIRELERIKEENEEGIDIDLLVDMVELAATPFPPTGRNWDDPSFHLINFVSEFQEERIFHAVAEHFPMFSPSGKERAIDFLIESNEETSVMAFLDILEASLPKEEIKIPVRTLKENTYLLKKVVEKYYTYIGNAKYKFDFYDLLLSLHKEDVYYQFKEAEIYPLLREDYTSSLEKVLAYNDSYNPKDVYVTWKEKYLDIRYEVDILLQLLDFYFREDHADFFKQAMELNVPVIKTRAIIVSLRRDQPVPDDKIKEGATNLESAEMFHWEIMRIRKEHKNPLHGKKQPSAAASHLFYHLLYELENPIYPTGIEIMDHVDTENAYSQPVRYYLARFSTVQAGEEYAAWIGAYNLEEGNDSLFMWEGTFTDFTPYRSQSIEEHKALFLKKRQESRDKDDNEVHYEEETNIGRIAIIGRNLVIGEDKVLPLVDLKMLTIEVQKSGLFGLKKKNMIVIYTKSKEVFLEIPENEIDYGEFGYAIYEHTAHLKEPPVIEYLEING